MNNEPYWESSLSNQRKFDAIVVGAGFAGLSVASKLATLGQSVVVLERSESCLGASTRNAGFACFGSVTEIAADMDTMGEQSAIELAATRLRGLRRLQREFGAELIGYESSGGYELVAPDTKFSLQYVNGALAQTQEFATGENVFEMMDEENIPPHLAKQGYKVVYNQLEGTLHSGRLHKAMWGKALLLGCEIHSNCQVLSIEEGVVAARTSNGLETYRGRHVYVCTNGLAPELTGEAVEPGRGQIIVTEPWPDNPFRGGWHMQEGFYYFRELEGRLLLGGGRHIDIQGETSRECSTTDVIQEQLQKVLSQLLPPNTHLDIEHAWAGVMGFTKNKTPHILSRTECETHVCVCNGMGVALARELIYSEPTIGGAQM